MSDDLKSWLCLMGNEKPYGKKTSNVKKDIHENFHGKNKHERCIQFLTAILNKDLPATYIYKKADQAGLSKTLLNRAKKELRIEHYRIGVTTMWRRMDAAKKTV